MSSNTHLFTSEWVSPGHSDKLLDSIAEAIVDYAIDADPKSRVAVDGVVKNNRLILAGEITCPVEIPFEKIVKDTIKNIGYTPDKVPGFNYENVLVETIFTMQSPDINQGVDQENGSSLGAGDQGIMYGGAINESPDFTPHSYFLAKEIGCKLYNNRYEADWMKPDIKTQVTIKYEDDTPVEVVDIVCAVSHKDTISQEEIKNYVLSLTAEFISGYCFEHALAFDNINWHINTTGKFVICGPESDSGEVGRKIVVDQAGAMNPVGGGNLNGKCPSKVDRTAVYQARRAAKWLVANRVCDKCDIQVSYSIGESKPISVYINTYGTNHRSTNEINKAVNALFSFSPAQMIVDLQLCAKNRPFRYEYCGMYGHIGESPAFGDIRTWEEIPTIDFDEALLIANSN
nr:MAG TPA: S adenosylmethionine synthase [Caudoviricetes sp.]